MTRFIRLSHKQHTYCINVDQITHIHEDKKTKKTRIWFSNGRSLVLSGTSHREMLAHIFFAKSCNRVDYRAKDAEDIDKWMPLTLDMDIDTSHSPPPNS